MSDTTQTAGIVPVRTALVPSHVPVGRPRRTVRRVLFGTLAVVFASAFVLGLLVGNPLSLLNIPVVYRFFIEARDAGGGIEWVVSPVKVSVGPSMVVFDIPGACLDKRGRTLTQRWSFEPDNLDHANSYVGRDGVAKISASDMVGEAVGSDGVTRDAVRVEWASFVLHPVSEDDRRSLLDVLNLPIVV